MAKARGAHPPRCPFCDRLVAAPRCLAVERLGNFEFGSCECGAVYAHDVTGHNVGAAWVEALGLACNHDWDLAWSLMPGEDYEDALLEHYDITGHLVQPSGRTEAGTMARGVLAFIRLARDVRDVAGTSLRLGLEAPASGGGRLPGPAAPPSGERRRYAKEQVRAAVAQEDWGRIQEMAREDPLVLRKIQRLLYSADPLGRWRAVTALGWAARALSGFRPAAVGDLVRTMLYASNDSAAANWGAIETVGEVIRRLPERYGSFLPHVLGFLRDPPSRPAVLWAVGRVGELHPKLVRSSAFFSLLGLLEDAEPAVRGHAVWALGRIRAQEAERAVQALMEDQAELDLFDGKMLSSMTVGSLAREALGRIQDRRILDTEEKTDMKQDAETGGAAGNEALEAAARLYEEASVLSNRGMSLDAMEKFQEALAVFEAAGRQREIANICDKLGDLHIRRGNMPGALSLYQRALAVCEKEGDGVSTVLLCEKVIDVYRHLKDLEKALPYYFRALELVEKFGDATKASFLLAGIGDIYQGQGKLQEALDAYRLALKISRGMGARERVEILEKGVAVLEGRLEEVR